MNDIDLTIPSFLLTSKGRTPPPKIRRTTTVAKYKMPKLKNGTSTSRRRAKEAADVAVLEAVRSGADTLGKVRKVLGETFADNELKNALTRLTKDRFLSKPKGGKRYIA